MSGIIAGQTPFPPLETENLRQRATRVIKAFITRGEIEPGRIYPVSFFATQLGVSATPVREALLDLVNDGLLETVRNRGFRVPTLSEDDLDDLIDLRVLLEVPTIVQVTAVATPEELEHSREHAQETLRAAEAAEQASFVEADMRFHLSLLEPLGNRRLLDMLAHVKNQMCVYGLRPLTEGGLLVASAREHVEIVQAVADGDANSASERMKAHLTSIRK